jgi:hypothetical protein
LTGLKQGARFNCIDPVLFIFLPQALGALCRLIFHPMRKSNAVANPIPADL